MLLWGCIEPDRGRERRNTDAKVPDGQQIRDAGAGNGCKDKHVRKQKPFFFAEKKKQAAP